jgi:EAL domain-containing protein (putative c-di-GMP-specific phosphodiesterase class I)
MADPRRNIAVLQRLRGIGVTVAVDDFGTGHSALAYLRRLPVGEIKIDKSFVVSMTSERNDAATVRAIIDLARSLELPVVAEGVEDEATAHALAQMGCTSVQGFHYSRPLPAAALTEWLRSTDPEGALSV